MVDCKSIVEDLNFSFFNQNDNCKLYTKHPFINFGNPFTYETDSYCDVIKLFDNTIYCSESNSYCEDEEECRGYTEGEWIIKEIKNEVRYFSEYVKEVSESLRFLGDNQAPDKFMKKVKAKGIIVGCKVKMNCRVDNVLEGEKLLEGDLLDVIKIDDVECRVECSRRFVIRRADEKEDKIVLLFIDNIDKVE